MKNILKLGFLLLTLMVFLNGCGKKSRMEYPGGQQKPNYDRDLDPHYADNNDGHYSDYDGNSPVTKKMDKGK